MKATELTESYIPDTISNILTKKGYKRLGKGTDQIAFLEPKTGMVLKIFGAKRGSDLGSYSKAQLTFKLFADYCTKHPDNEFLPHFSGWETFEHGGLMYLQIRCERLFEFKGHKKWAEVLEKIADSAEDSKSENFMQGWIDNHIDNGNDDDYGDEDDYCKAVRELVIHLGEAGFRKLWITIHELSKIADNNNIVLDLHSGNFMLGSDGHIVISDPFFSGWGNQ